MTRRLLIALLLLPAIAGAQTITNVSGVYESDSTVTIAGSGFGTKPTPAPVTWDYLANIAAYSGLSQGDTIPVSGTLNSPCDYYDDTPGAPWDDRWWCGWEGVHPAQYWDTGNRVSGRPHYIIPQKGSLRSIDYGLSSPTKFYVDWWIKVNMEISGLASTKIIRVWPDETHYATTGGGLSWTTEHATNHSDQDHNCVDDGTTSYWGDWGGDAYVGTWFHMATINDGSGNIACGYGETQTIMENTVTKDFGYYQQYPYNQIWGLGCDPSTNISAFAACTTSFSEIYVDTTFARVAIGDASTWSNTEHYEMQIPTAWNANGQSITVTFNQGSFAADDSVWMYVFDSDNDVSPGYGPLIIEGEGAAPPGEITPVDTLRCVDYDP